MFKITRFQERVYRAVRKIPRGKVMTYKQVARLADSPRAFRAAGNALNKNPHLFYREKGSQKIPCHRVIRTDGKIGGYNRGVSKKISLLKKEGIIIKKSQILNPKSETISNI